MTRGGICAVLLILSGCGSPPLLPDMQPGESTRVLEDLALGRRVQLFYPGITRDRYDRALAHVVTTDGKGPKLWLNIAMVVRGAGSPLSKHRRARAYRQGGLMLFATRQTYRLKHAAICSSRQRSETACRSTQSGNTLRAACTVWKRLNWSWPCDVQRLQPADSRQGRVSSCAGGCPMARLISAIPSIWKSKRRTSWRYIVRRSPSSSPR